MNTTPKQLGFHCPSEFEKHDATWLSWPHNKDTWPGKISTIFPSYCNFVELLSHSEKVNINVGDEKLKLKAMDFLSKTNTNWDNIEFHFNPTNDAWCRDHGPAFIVNRKERKKAIVNWGYNSWGGKYPPFDLDNEVPKRIGKALNLQVFNPEIIMEGGSIELNGDGSLLTTTACLMNKNRNPHLSQKQIENYLIEYYGVEQVLWLNEGIVGDDTDGHIDDLSRFASENTVITAIEDSNKDENYYPLKDNLKRLVSMKLVNGKSLEIIELPMPSPLYFLNRRLPASYANFYICNSYVIVPTFRDKNDDKALMVLQKAFPNHKVVGIDSYDIIWGLGSFHCLSQQEPSI